MRATGLVLLCGLLAVLAGGCAASSPPRSFQTEGPADSSESGALSGERAEHTAAPAPAGAKLPAGGTTGGSAIPRGGPDKGDSVDPLSGRLPPDAPRPAGAADAMAGADKRPREAKDDSRNLQSGTLTGGSFDDNLEPRFFTTFVSKLSQSRQLGDLPGKFRGQRLLLTVKDGAGNPVGNARVQVAAAGTNPVELLSRTDGRVVVVSSWDELPEGPLAVTVTPPDGGDAVKATVPAGSNRWEITLPSAQGRLPQDLDFAIVLDTTGSMGDELQYLKAEIKGIAAAVHEKFPQVNQRYALVLYKDDGDEYVTRHFDFTASLDDFRKDLGAQSAGGGGDYPEAVHRGLEDALQLRWKDGNAARVLFLVGDAPPHAQFMGRTMTAVNNLRKKGVSIYPVACSGYDDAAEFVFRSAALVTGGQFLFLTDDSHVGNAHGEPHIPFYHVQKLDQLMVRMIASELSGKRVEPEKGQILRTVGKPLN
jgi:hypothetical protein